MDKKQVKDKEVIKKEQPASNQFYIWIFIGFVIRIVLEQRLSFLKHYPYFNTPLIDLRQLLEAFNNYRVSGGTEYFLDHNAINQPLALVKLYHLIFLNTGVNGIKAFLFACDLISVTFQCLIIRMVYMKEKDAYRVKFIQILLIFNPLSMISPAVHNLVIVKYMMISLISFQTLKNGFKSVVTDVLCGVTLYVDPSLIYVLIPLRLIANLVDNRHYLLTLKVIFSFLIWGLVFFSIILFAAQDWKADFRNYLNIFYIKDHSENIGIYWYLFVELFS
jgi:GPI transamidase subunit PIG-U